MRAPTRNRRAQGREAAALSLLRPVLKLLFTRGLAREALQEICDTAYLEAADEKLTARGGRVKWSRVAALSGVPITRAKRLKEAIHKRAESHRLATAAHASLMGAAARIVTGWYADADFNDDDGHPVPCRPEGLHFKTLVERYGGGCDMADVLSLLLSTQTVELNAKGELKPRGRHVLAAPGSEEAAENAFEALVDLSRALEVNERKRFTGMAALQRTCANDRMPKRMVPLFRAMIRQNTESFLESVDDWLVQHEVREESMSAAEPAVRLGVGVYVIADE